MANLSYIMFFILFFAALYLIFVLYNLYTQLITKKNKVYEALGTVDVQLTQRHDLIPNILTIAKKFMEHEDNIFTKITELRGGANNPYDLKDPAAVAEHLQMANALDQQMAQLKIQVENYPTLKSDQTVVQAMTTYNEVEANIAAARRFYNTSVSSLNTSVEIFPGSLIASIIKIQTMPFYKAEETSKAPVNASDYLE